MTTRGLWKLTAVANNLQAQEDWQALCDKARNQGQGHLIEGLEPPKDAGWKRVDKAIAKLRKAMTDERDAAIPLDHKRGHSVLFKS